MPLAVAWKKYVQERLADLGVPELLETDIPPGCVSNAFIVDAFRGHHEKFDEVVSKALKKPQVERRVVLSAEAMKLSNV